MSVHGDIDNEFVNDFVDDLVTLISRLDISNPLHLHPNDSTALTVVSIKLKGTKNYQVWSCAMLFASEGKNKIGFIDGSCRRSNNDEEELKETYDKVDGSNTFGLHHKIHTLRQNGSSIAEYYHRLNAPWKQFDAMIELHRCTCHAADHFKKHNQLMKLMQFLMGLDDSYMQIRSSILFRETLPDVRSAYATISSEESHRVDSGSIESEFNNGPRPNTVNNNKQGGGSSLVCEHCGFNGHSIDRCFKLIGYPADFGKKKSGQIFKNKNVSNNNDVGSSSSSGQYGRIIVDSGENQHVTHTDKELDNVYDISHLKIKVGHPNRTEAFIYKIENLKLSNGLVLYDVLVILEYCVTLIYVHKLAKDNKIFVTFDESRCYFLNQDLNLKNVMGIGNQCLVTLQTLF
ncbi:ribonuclease H-like domain-containing protein [Tanacetum coccineum]|uniref:Ribonuclease H-like domain-containing protein n=1 Tax=Tanacetum coccineum TaxID=301880 RepID=A0ABQ5E8F6_9ASTR